MLIIRQLFLSHLYYSFIYIDSTFQLHKQFIFIINIRGAAAVDKDAYSSWLIGTNFLLRQTDDGRPNLLAMHYGTTSTKKYNLPCYRQLLDWVLHLAVDICSEICLRVSNQMHINANS